MKSGLLKNRNIIKSALNFKKRHRHIYCCFLFFILIFGSSGCFINSSNGYSNSSSSSHQNSNGSSNQQGPQGPQGPQGQRGPRGTNLALYDANNIKVGSWLIKTPYSHEPVEVWDDTDGLLARYIFQQNGMPETFSIQGIELYYESTNCSGTPYALSREGGNQVFRLIGNNVLYKTTRITKSIAPNSSSNGTNCTYSPNMNPPFTHIEVSPYNGTLPLMITAPLSVVRDE